MEIYFMERFTFQGKASYDLPVCGLSLAERARRAFPQATLHLGVRLGEDGEKLLGMSLKTLSDYPLLCARRQREILFEHVRRGVLLQTFDGVVVEEDVELENGVYLGHGCYIERGCRVGAGSRLGPYAYLRKGSVVGRNCRLGDFTEMKNATLGDGSKMAHLAYLGDADVGKNCNVGCGVVFVNYDGAKKSRSLVEDGCFIGSNCNVIAPVRIGRGAYIAAGSTLTCDLQADDFCIARARETVFKGRGRRYYDP